MKTALVSRMPMSRIRVFLIATCIVATTARLSAEIILLSRLSDAEAHADGSPVSDYPPPQTETGFLPAHLQNSAHACINTYFGTCCGTATSTSSSIILINSPMEGLRVNGGGTAGGAGCTGVASAKVIVLGFALTEFQYSYSVTGQLNGSSARATLTSETGTIFARFAPSPLSENGTLPPGTYTLLVSVYASISGSSDASFDFSLHGPVSVARATNLSTRLLVGTGNDVGIGGFIVNGNGPRHLLLRGIGPSLNGVIANAQADPSLQLRGPTGFQDLTNDNWRDSQSAIVADLAPGAYTVVLSGNSGSTGVGLVEVYDLSTNQDSRLANISTRANVATDDDIMIAGFILDGGSVGTTIVRGLGPSLTGAGVSALPDPKLELRDPQGVLTASDDNWRDDTSQAAIIQASGLAPSNPLESAIAAILLPGPYTVLLSGVNNETGVGLVEVYDNPVIVVPSQHQRR